MRGVSYAKINLFFFIIGKREDGYHNIVSLMSRINIYDTISIEFETKKREVTCNKKDVPNGKNNIAWKAIEIFSQKIEKEISCHITIQKKIPVGAGLGGGSSNAATVLTMLNRYHKNCFSKKTLMDMGKKIGADVPFFIFEKSAIAEGIGEKLKEHKIEPYNIVLAFPNINVSTKTIYKKVNLELTKNKKNFKEEVFLKNKFDFHLIKNDFEPILFSIYPELENLKKYFIKQGANASLMSGSGSSIFGLFKNREKAEKTFLDLKQKTDYQVFLTQIL